MSQLKQLREMTDIVADTGVLAQIANIKPLDATTNPSLLLQAANSGENDELIAKAINMRSNSTDVSSSVAEIFAILIGAEIAKIVPGRVSTEIDARHSFDSQLMINSARRLIALYEAEGVGRERVLIKIAATWEGIKAAEILEKHNIQCNLTLVFNMAQARACAEAGIFLISPFVGRIYDYFKAQSPENKIRIEVDPGVASVKAICNFYRTHNYKTIVMGASFRSTEQVLALAGCDRLTVAPSLLNTLSQTHGNVVRQLLIPESQLKPPLPHITESNFRLELCNDAMANTKLAEGISQFCKDQVALEKLLESIMQKDDSDV